MVIQLRGDTGAILTVDGFIGMGNSIYNMITTEVMKFKSNNTRPTIVTTLEFNYRTRKYWDLDSQT